MSHQAMSIKGGQAKSEAKTKAARKNASKPRGKWATAIHYECSCESGKVLEGTILIKGKMPDNQTSFFGKAEAKVYEHGVGFKNETIDEFLQLDTISRMI